MAKYRCVFHCLWLTTESLDFFTPSFSWVLERDPFIETETGFGSSFSETVRSVCKTDTSLSYPLKPLSILLSPCSFTGECLKITSKSASKIVNDGRDYFMLDDVGNVCMNLARMIEVLLLCRLVWTAVRGVTRSKYLGWTVYDKDRYHWNAVIRLYSEIETGSMGFTVELKPVSINGLRS